MTALSREEPEVQVLELPDLILEIDVEGLKRKLPTLCYEFSGSENRKEKVLSALRQGRFPRLRAVAEKSGYAATLSPPSSVRSEFIISFYANVRDAIEISVYGPHEAIAYFLAHEVRHWVQFVTGDWRLTLHYVAQPFPAILTWAFPFLYNFMPIEIDANNFAEFAVQKDAWLDLLTIRKSK